MKFPALNLLLLSLLFLVTSYVFTRPVFASDLSLVVSPPRTDLTIKPGETLQKTIKVTNTSDTPLNLKATVIDFIVTDDVGTPVKVTENASGRFLASPWFTLDNPELTVPPKSSSQLIVLITAPLDALPGGHYSGVYFEPSYKKDGSRTISYTTAQVGSLFALTVEGDINYDALIKDFSAPTLSEFGPIDFTLTVENQSDTHITPNSVITIKDMLGRELASLSPDSLNIFPFASRTTRARWDTVWALGRFTATATVSYGPGLTASRDFMFWVLPYRLLAAIMIIILVLLAGGISLRRHLKSRNDERDVTIDELKRRIAELENNSR